MPDVKKLLGNRIRLLRKRLKLSQEALALRAGLDRTYVASLENGKRNVSIINIYRLATALECSLKEFFDYEDFSIIYPNTPVSKVAENESENYE